MDLKAVWEQLKKEQLEQGNHENLAYEALLKNKSAHPVAKLRKGVNLKLYFSIAFALIFLFITIYTPFWIVKLFIGLVSLAYTVGIVFLVGEQKKLKALDQADLNIQEYLKLFVKQIRQILKLELYWAIAIFPISLTGGFLLGYTEGKTVNELEFTMPFYIGLLGCYVVIFPIAWFLTKWMNKLHYGKRLKKIDAIIEEYDQGVMLPQQEATA